MNRCLLAAPMAATVMLACGGPLVPSPLQEEPVCADFEIGASRTVMRGSLRFPVTVTVFDGSDPIARATITGLRKKDDHPTPLLLPNDNAEYEVHWAQCENERAPRPLVTGKDLKEAASYECGKIEIYKKDKFVTKKGDPKSRSLTFVTPPKPECWMSQGVPPEPPATPTAETSAAPAADLDAGVADAADDAASAQDAGLASSLPQDAGAKDASAKDVGK